MHACCCILDQHDLVDGGVEERGRRCTRGIEGFWLRLPDEGVWTGFSDFLVVAQGSSDGDGVCAEGTCIMTLIVSSAVWKV